MASVSTPPVVVGVDGSPSSLGALDYAAGWAGRHHTPLRIVYAHMPPYTGTPFSRFLVMERDEDVQRAIKVWLRELAARVRDEHTELTDVQAADSIGNAAKMLIDESEQAEVTVVGCRGLGGFNELMLGSTSAQLATHGRGPIVVVRPPVAVQPGPEQRLPHMPLGPVLACYDGSPASVAGLRFAADEAMLREVTMIVAYVYDGDGAAARQLLTEGVAAWSDNHGGRPVELRPIYSQHHPQYALLEATRDAALTVVGSRGHGQLASVLLGSVSRYMIHQAYGPVAVIHPADR